MAFNFDSGQFNKESTPKRLGNWQVPRWAPTRARPLEYRPDPKPICDENGHFLPGAPRGSSRCFGHYTGTWDLPRKITRKVADELAKEPPDGRFPDWLHPRVQRPKVVARLRGAREKKDTQRPDPQSFQDSEKDNSKYNEDQLHDDKEVSSPHEGRNEVSEGEGGVERGEGNGEEAGEGVPYEPGELSAPEHRHEAAELRARRDQLRADQFWADVADRARDDSPDMRCKKISNTPKLPSVNVTQNFNFAKKMHVGNLEHQPLPDTLGYRNLTKIGEHRDSDIVVKPYAIGWKGYGAAGPTCCTKMRVHRPKTCDPKKTDSEANDKLRPTTSIPDLGGQYKKPMSLMDLAICWDFRPDNPRVEPRPPKHIDGSNGSKAPAVFTMVHTPKEEAEPLTIGHTNPIFNQNQITQNVGHHPVPYFEKDMTKEKRKDSCDVQYCSQHSSASDKSKEKNSSFRQNGVKPACDGVHGCGTPPGAEPAAPGRRAGRERARPDKLQPIKDAWNTHSDKHTKEVMKTGHHGRNSLESYEKTPLAQGKLHQSSPNESQLSRRPTKESLSTNNNSIKHKNCMPCNVSRSTPDNDAKEDFKFAFKAGNPNSVQSSSTNSSKDSKGFKIPKMRHPYSKKSYTIPTLSPPFTIWKDANATGYPEHWRLASVYQHAYRPPDQRRKPLIDSVYQ